MSFDRTMSILQPCVFVINFTSKLHYAVNKMLVTVMVSDVQRILTTWPRQCTNVFRASVAREDKRIELNCEMLLLLLIVHQTRNLQMMWICSCLVEKATKPRTTGTPMHGAAKPNPPTAAGDVEFDVDVFPAWLKGRQTRDIWNSDVRCSRSRPYHCCRR
jgi:hypothetical protein